MSAGNFPAQVAPMGHVARVALQEQEAGFIKQQALQQVITQNLSKDNEQVEKTSAGEQGQRVRRRRHDRGGERSGGHGRGSGQDGSFGEELSRQSPEQFSGTADNAGKHQHGDPQSAAGPPGIEDPPGVPEPPALSDHSGQLEWGGNVWAGNIVNVKV